MIVFYLVEGWLRSEFFITIFQWFKSMFQMFKMTFQFFKIKFPIFQVSQHISTHFKLVNTFDVLGPVKGPLEVVVEALQLFEI